MAWNRSDETVGRAAPCVPKSEGRIPVAGPKLRRGLVAGLVVVLGALVAAYFIFGRDASPSRPQAEPTKRSVIAEVAPQIVTNAEPQEVVEKEKKSDPNARPTRVGERLNGYVMLPDGRIHKMTGKAQIMNPDPDPTQIFDYPADNEIATLVSMQPGDMIVGPPIFDTFEDEFLKSLKTPIVVKADDSEHDKELKRAVNAAKIELKAAYDRGENIAEIMTKTHEEYQRLEQYRSEVFGQALEYTDNDAQSSQDVEDYLVAVNKLLEAKGIKPIEESTLMDIKLEFDRKMEEIK